MVSTVVVGLTFFIIMAVTVTQVERLVSIVNHGARQRPKVNSAIAISTRHTFAVFEDGVGLV